MVHLDELTLYEPKLLHQLEFWRSPAKFNPPITATAPGETWMKVRPLQEGDYDRGFLELLSQLTKVGNISKGQFLMQFARMRASGDYYVTVIEDTRINRIIGSATLVLEHKFIHECSVRGRLEDVVVNNTYRGKQLGKLIVVTVNLLAQHLGCYKMSLECKDHLIPFYESLGYVLEPGNSNSMNIRYDGAKEAPVRSRQSVILVNATNPVDPS
ncbi:probable glucosamine 6-phosphate N-acetyltransferase isoform X2 [Phlebotomus argentipes]|uniref:probable glucosamine 6-phosphate N-acetyltransferase isoform X2 n=1 Tax=Phlebotomus argentipes TaxID=94469 RepID=UPI002892F607|nr:probable glucosamine 6-phosphate N-acetyltransferase isoform X2 [Phlebotomus argentipes]